MPDGDMRRPPLLWEQRLAKRVTSLGPGISTSSSSNVVEDFGTSTGYDEPDDTITTLGTPSTPTVTGSLRMLVVAWDGLDTDGDAYNGENQWVDVHVGGSATFTPGTATVRGQLYEAGRITIGDLEPDTVYYAKLVGKDAEGNTSTASAAGSATTSLILSTDIGTGQITAGLVSFDATAIGGIQQFVGTATPTTSAAEGSTWINTSDGAYYTLTGGTWVKRQWDTQAIAAGAINTLQIATGAITADSGIIANAAIGSAQLGTAIITDANIVSLSADKIDAGTLSGDRINGGTITGTTIQTRASGLRVLMDDIDAVKWLNGATAHGEMRAGSYTNWTNTSVNGILVESPGNFNVENDLTCTTLHGTSFGIRFSALSSDTGLTNLIITGSGVLREDSSKQAIKYDMAALSGSLSPSVDPGRQLGVATVDPDAVLDLAVTEFSVINDGEPTERRVLGFIADDVADKLPIAATYDSEGAPSGVLNTAILASLVAVVKDQADTIADLTARIEALEA